MRRFYSRLRATEERKNNRRAVFYILLTLVSIVLLVVFGLPSIVKMAAFLSDLRRTSTPVDQNDITPPAPPRLDNLPEATNQKSIEIQGSAEEGANITIYINDETQTVVADNEGRFNLRTNLIKGENTISAIAKDSAGNESQKGNKEVIVFDDESPNLEITSPENNKQFYGSKERQIVIDGKTEPGASLSINDRFVFVEEDGTFSYATSLSEGDNNFNIKAQDKAGNTTEISLTLKFTP